MNSRLYWRQQILSLIFQLFCMAGLAAFLLVSGSRVDSVVLVLVVWILILAVYMVFFYFRRKAQLDALLALSEQLEEKYLISEVMDKPARADDRVYYELLRMANKSMLEKIGEINRERTEYKEYIEQWVHEVKTPIAAMKLICENHRFSVNRDMLVELEKTNRFTEQALYYARSECAEKDYLVKEIRLFEVVHRAIADNKHLLLQNGVRIDLQETEDIIFCDEKWLCFILNQMIVNSVKYCTGQLILKFYAEQERNKVTLCIQDNGIGIEADDLPRIFEKGFTGKNGRRVSQDSTGIGLYLCRRLCDKLGIELDAVSSECGTIMRLSFLVNDFIHQVQG